MRSYNNSYGNFAGQYQNQCLPNIAGHAGDGHTWGAVNGAFANHGRISCMANKGCYFTVDHFYFSASYSNSTYKDNCKYVSPYNYSVYMWIRIG